MSALEPGLYRWTFGGKSYIGILDSEGDFSYLSSDGRHCTRIHCAIGDARPLIVLDLSYPGCGPQDLADRVRGGWPEIADQIEAQTKPARIPEPKHIGSLMTASATDHNNTVVWTKYSEVTGTRNWISPGGIRREWDELIDPEPFPFGGKS